MILIVLGLAVRVSTLPTFLRKMYGGKGGKAKTPWAFSFQAKRMTQDRKAKGQRSGVSIPSRGISSSNAWAYCISSPNAWARGISSQNAQGQRGEALGIFTRIANLPCVLVRISISKQNAPINEVSPVRRPYPEWDKMQVLVGNACFSVFLAMLAGRVSKEGG